MTRLWKSSLMLVLMSLVGLEASAQAPESDLGTITFPTSGSAEAQQHFLRGVKLLHSFTFEAAEGAFREASRLDPDFAMAFWGEALSHNHPLGRERDVDSPRAALNRLAPTREQRLKKAPTEREKGFLRAVEILFGEGTEAQRETAYSEAMADLAEKYPDDHEVQAFYAVSLLAAANHHPDDKHRMWMRAGAVAQNIFMENPDHPGAAHYTIHSFDDPIHAPLALTAAKRYAEIAPDAAHALHMPSHIFIQHGMWDRVAKSNEASYQSAISLWRRRDELSETEKFYNEGYVFHALDWGQYGELQRGNYQKAKKHIDLIRPVAEKAKRDDSDEWVSELTARYIIETEKWKTLPLSEDTSAHGLLATGLGAARIGDVATAEKAAAKLAALHDQAKDDDNEERAKRLAIMRNEVAALVELARGRGEKAVALMERAVEIEETRELPRGAATPLKPAHELFGEILLELERFEDAALQFGISLERMPNRTLSLRGLARASVKTGDLERAKEAYARLTENLDEYPDHPIYGEAKGFIIASNDQ